MKAGVILTTAAGIVDGVRQQTHGEKERSFETIASFWNAYLRKRGITTIRLIESTDVAHMMMLLKMARAIEGQLLPDHWVDMCGYAGLAGELATGHQSDAEEAVG